MQLQHAPVKLLLTPKEAANALGIGITLLYDLLAKGDILSVKIGRRRCISVRALERYVDSLEQANEEEAR